MNFEVIFLFVLALIWIVFATIQDLRKREIANWLNFSLIVFALGFRFFYSLFSEQGFSFFYNGLIGLAIFVVLGHLMYYARFFAGGDAKLMIALGVILPFTPEVLVNLNLFLTFFILFLFVGAVYIILVSLFLSFKHFKNFQKEFGNQVKKRKKIVYLIFVFGLILMILGIYSDVFFILGVLIFLLPYIYFYTKAVDEACMIRKIRPNDVTEGDWLYKDIKIRGKLIRASWDGLTKKDISLIKRSGKGVEIRQGIQFSPVFFFSFLIFGYLWQKDLIESVWKFIGF